MISNVIYPAVDKNHKDTITALRALLPRAKISNYPGPLIAVSGAIPKAKRKTIGNIISQSIDNGAVVIAAKNNQIGIKF